MDANNIIKGLIPQEIISDVPMETRNHVAGKIVMFFKEQNPELFGRLGSAGIVPPEYEGEVVAKIREAALAAKTHHNEMVKLYGDNNIQP